MKAGPSMRGGIRTVVKNGSPGTRAQRKEEQNKLKGPHTEAEARRGTTTTASQLDFKGPTTSTTPNRIARHFAPSAVRAAALALAQPRVHEAATRTILFETVVPLDRAVVVTVPQSIADKLRVNAANRDAEGTVGTADPATMSATVYLPTLITRVVTTAPSIDTEDPLPATTHEAFNIAPTEVNYASPVLDLVEETAARPVSEVVAASIAPTEILTEKISSSSTAPAVEVSPATSPRANWVLTTLGEIARVIDAMTSPLHGLTIPNDQIRFNVADVKKVLRLLNRFLNATAYEFRNLSDAETIRKRIAQALSEIKTENRDSNRFTNSFLALRRLAQSLNSLDSKNRASSAEFNSIVASAFRAIPATANFYQIQAQLVGPVTGSAGRVVDLRSTRPIDVDTPPSSASSPRPSGIRVVETTGASAGGQERPRDQSPQSWSDPGY